MSQITADAPNPAIPPAKTDPDATGVRGLLKKGNFRDYGLLIAL